MEEDLKARLLQMKSELKEEDEKKQARQKAEQIRKRKEKEKHKSFEEPLNESSLDWHKYK
ncbi:YqkE family protein [Bacillus velezensis]